MSLSSNLITQGLGPGNNYVLGGVGGNIINQISNRKVPGTHSAVGYWGRNIHRRVLLEESQPRIRALKQEELSAGGLKAALWMGIISFGGNSQLVGSTEIIPGMQLCSCYKKTSKYTDRRCMSCYGQKYVPGYAKFGHRTYFMSSIDTTSIISGLESDTDITPNRLRLPEGGLTGTVTSPIYPFQHVLSVGSVWESDLVVSISDSIGSGVLAEFSLDGGATWYGLQYLGVLNPSGAGQIRFRVTIHRTDSQIQSPLFEILRTRHPILPYDGDRRGPFLLFLKNMPPRKWDRGMHGMTQEDTGIKYWTAPLAFFDPTIQVNTTQEALKENFFIQFLEGQYTNRRYPIVDWTPDDPIGYMVRQYFTARSTNEREFYSLVF